MPGFTKMVDMAKTPVEVNKEVTANAPSPAPMSAIAANVPTYPYGLCITLEKEQLDKLGIDGECAVGDMIHLSAMAKVTSCSERETEGGKDCRIELQITHLATENEDNEDEDAQREVRAKRRYGGEHDEEPDGAGGMRVAAKDYGG